MSPADRDRVACGWLREYLGALAPEGWQRVDMSLRMLATRFEADVYVTDGNGVTRKCEADLDRLANIAHTMQLVTYDPSLGTWLSLRMYLMPGDQWILHENYHWEPQWSQPVDAQAYRDDLAAWPRDRRFVYPWLAARLPEFQDPPPDAHAAQSAANLPPALQIDQLNEPLHDIASNVLHYAPPGWKWAFITFREVGEYTEAVGDAVLLNGARIPWSVPHAVATQISTLRRKMRRAGQGTWHTGKLNFNFPVAGTTEWDWDGEPEFTGTCPPSEYQREIDLFDWSEEWMPPWLETRARGVRAN